jgi:hypothetical protein
MQIHRSVYGVYHPNFDRHVYRRLTISQSGRHGDAEPFNRGHDDDSIQFGTLTVDGLSFIGHQNSGMPLIQITDDNPTGTAETHIRNVQVLDRKDGNRRALVNLGGGPRPKPKSATSVPVYLHDYFGSGRHARVVSVKSSELRAENASIYRSEPPLTGDESRVTEVANVEFPELLHPVDDQPPATVITRVQRIGNAWRVRGVCEDNGDIKQVTVNGAPARPVSANFSEWEATLTTLPADGVVKAMAVDVAGNTERLPHVVSTALDTTRKDVKAGD